MTLSEIVIIDSLATVGKHFMDAGNSGSTFNFWSWIAVLEFVIILWLVFRRKWFGSSRAIRAKVKNEVLNQNVDFDNVINSSFNAGQIFDELKVRCHPDRFPNDDFKKGIAQNIFQEASQNRHNVKKLLLLKEEARLKLNLEF